MAIKTGTSGNDTLIGTVGIDALKGLGGNDQITGLAGADLLDGGAGIDTVRYDGSFGVNVNLTTNMGLVNDAAGDQLLGFENVVGSGFGDVIVGNGLDNVLTGGAGGDILDGFSGTDTADYAGAKQGVVLSLLEATGFGGEADGDRFTSIENIIGSKFADNIEGDVFDNVLRGGTGADVLDGDGGTDTADYSTSAAGVGVSLVGFFGFGTGSGGDAEGDILTGLENLTGSGFKDQLLGSDLANVLSGGNGADQMAGNGGADTLKGGSGNDLLIGGAGGDQLDGGSGVDTLDYRDSAAGVTIDLKFFKSGFGGDAEGDLISGFENVNGSANKDDLSGDDKANVLSGDAGSDRLFGAGGNDTLAGGLGADALGGSAGADDFKYFATAESGVTAATRDVLFDFSPAQGDDIDLQAVDAKTATAGNQAFSFVGTEAFTAAGQVRYFFEGDHTVVELNTTGANGAESQIELNGHLNLAAGDFLL
jgi:Ca2+-binding RTX toxin-like protein